MRKTALIAVATGVALALPLHAQARTPTPPPLTGEILGNGASSGTSSIRCDPDGISTFKWDVSGTAFGPYPGTFRESGRLTFGPQVSGGEFPTGPMLTFHARFRIDSPAGRVRGTKTLVLPQPSIGFATGTCFTEGVNAGHVLILAHDFQLRYRAVIETGNAECRATGTAANAMSAADGVGGIDEFFDTTDSFRCEDDEDDDRDDDDDDDR
jgi:hypothetical protein